MNDEPERGSVRRFSPAAAPHFATRSPGWPTSCAPSRTPGSTARLLSRRRWHACGSILSLAECGLVLVTIALVVTTEIVNTAIEAAVDLAAPEPHPSPRRPKTAPPRRSW